MKDKEPQTFSGIAEDFNFSAQRFLDSSNAIDLLLAKYSALQSFRLTELEDREQLAAALFDTCEKALKPHAEEGKFPALGENFVKAADQLLAVLAEPENALLLPKRAPEVLGEFALVFIQKAERVEEKDFPTWREYDSYRDSIKVLAPATLKYAKKIKAIADRQTDNVATSKNFTVPKPLVLKKSDKDLAP